MSSNPAVPTRVTHRTFSAEQKARILEEYAAATTPTERATVMQRAGVYSSLISNWRKQLATAPAPRSPDRQSGEDAFEASRLRQENERLKRRLEKSELLLDALGKVHALLRHAASETMQDE